MFTVRRPLIQKGILAMKHKKNWDDSTFEHLLKTYERPSLSAEKRAQLIEALQDDSIRGAGSNLRILKTGTVSRTISRTVWGFSLAAGLVLVAGTAFFIAVWQPDIPVPYRIAGSESGSGTGANTVTKSGILTSGETTLAFETDTESVTLSPSSTLKISGDPLRRLTGNMANRYELEGGSVYIEHKKGTPAFTVDTEWGTIVPLGTILNLALIPDGLELTCLEDALTFTTKQNMEYLVEAGKRLSLSERGKSIVVSPIGDENADEDNPANTVENASGTTASVPEKTAGDSDAPDAFEKPLWTQKLDSIPQRMHVVSEAAVLIYPERIVTRKLSDGAVIATVSLSPAIELSDTYLSLVITYGKGTISAYRIPGLEKQWESETGTVAFTSFTIAAGSIYLPSADGSLYMHDAASGALIKKITIGTGLYGKPYVSSSIAYFSTLDRRFIALDTESGKKIWEYRGTYRFVDDNPVVIENTVITYADDGMFIALDTKTGSFLWTASYSGKIEVKPIAWKTGLIFVNSKGLNFLSALGKAQTLSAQAVLDVCLVGGNLYYADSEGFAIIRADDAKKSDAAVGVSGASGAGSAGTFPTTTRLLREKFVFARMENGILLAIREDNTLNCYRIEN